MNVTNSAITVRKAWIGTPVHELSHLIACWIARHQVRDFALFKPNPKTGGLGYVDHSCDANSFYQRTFGNLLISIAPFIGGALALHFAGGELAPSLLNRVETLPTPGVDNLTTGGAVDYFRALYATGAAFAHEFHARASDPNFRFFFAVYALVSTAAHLAPSKSDFSGAGRPALIVCTVVIAVWFAGALAGPAIAPYFAAAADLARRFEVLLACALLFLLIGAAALFAATVFMRPAENGRK